MDEERTGSLQRRLQFGGVNNESGEQKQDDEEQVEADCAGLMNAAVGPVIQHSYSELIHHNAYATLASACILS